jgi:hypothetical protein
MISTVAHPRESDMRVRALIGHASPCGCVLDVRLLAPNERDWVIDWCRCQMREQGLRPQEVEADKVPRVVRCAHGPRRARR